MSEPETLQEFKQGVELLRNGFPRQALDHLRRAVELDKLNPFYQSFLGVALASVGGSFSEAENLCDSAVRKQRNRPELYLNLAEVYRRMGRKEDAIETLYTGLKLTRQDPRLAEALMKLGRRRAPVFPFLDRENFLNVQMGKLRHQIRSR